MNEVKIHFLHNSNSADFIVFCRCSESVLCPKSEKSFDQKAKQKESRCERQGGGEGSVVAIIIIYKIKYCHHICCFQKKKIKKKIKKGILRLINTMMIDDEEECGE